jgi:PAS domain S-box-containing protein
MQEKQVVLIVDNEPRMCESLKLLLQDRGYAVKTATVGQEALAFLKEETWDLLVLDIDMPGLNGFSFLNQWKHAPRPFIVTSGYPTVDSVITAYKKGALDYIRKPFDPDDLMDIVCRTLNENSPPLSPEFWEGFIPPWVQPSAQGFALYHEGHIAYANRAFSEMLGHDLHDVIGLSLQELVGMVRPEGRASVTQCIEKLLKGDLLAQRCEWKGIRKGGQRFRAAFFVNVALLGGHLVVQLITDHVREETGLELAEALPGPAHRRDERERRGRLEVDDYGGSELILIVDRDEKALESAGTILGPLGYKVLLTRSGKEARDIYWAVRGDIDLLVIERELVRRGGETDAWLRSAQPGVSVFFSTEKEDVDPSNGKLDFLQKPFDRKTMPKRIREKIDGVVKTHDIH